MSGIIGNNIVRDGLVLNLDAADRKSYPGSGTIWYDRSGNKKSCLLTGGASFDNNNGGSIIYNGIDGTGTLSNLGFTEFSQITVSVWYYSNVNSSTALTQCSSVNNAFILHYRGAGFYLKANDNTVSNYLAWQSTIPYNQWVMLTGTWDNSTMRLYQNGIKQSNELSFAGGVNGKLANISTILLGFYFNSFQPYTNGKIANFNLYNRALSASEVTQNFNATRKRFNI